MESNSSEDSSVSDYTTESSDEDGMEISQINGTKLMLPQGLCEKKEIFKEFFSPSLWNSLSESNQSYLRSFLPTFPENDEKEKTKTLQKLFNYETFKFNSPLNVFHNNLKAGFFRPDISRMRSMIQKAERREAKHRYQVYKENLKYDLIESKKKLLNQVKNLPPGVDPKVEKPDVLELDLIRHRTKRRYLQIVSSIRAKTESCYSSDENYFDNIPISLPRKHRRHLNSIKSSISHNKEPIFVSSVSHKTNGIDLEKYITSNINPFYINEDSYKELIRKHRKRRQEECEEQEFHLKGITLEDVIHRVDLPHLKIIHTTSSLSRISDHKPSYRKKTKKEPTPPSIRSSKHLTSVPHLPSKNSSNSDISDSDSIIDAVTVQPVKHKRTDSKFKSVNRIQNISKPKPEPVRADVKKEKELPNNKVDCSKLINPISSYSQYGKITPVTLSDLEGIDMMNLPIDLDNSNIDMLDLNNKPELMQETHSNFLSLIRDIICSTNEHRMSLDALEKRLRTWQESPISPLNDWYCLSDNWVSLLQSAINFLCGHTTEQPDDFVPYLEFKSLLNVYQWIGAGRDSDALLTPLCKYWMDHQSNSKIMNKSEDIELSDLKHGPPPPRYPTDWRVRKPTSEEVSDFQQQEKRRYENPHKPFTYFCNGYHSVVAPLRGIYNPLTSNTKARGHSILTADRPNFVTILSLVRDATARLPNGEGTRADIVELLKSSQYISSTATDNVLQTVVSGALDRMHTQSDPCVKYDTKKKIWIYLHRNRTEEDFEKIHKKLQAASKPIKKSKKGSRSRPKPIEKAKATLKEKDGKNETPDKTKMVKKPQLANSQPIMAQCISEVKMINSTENKSNSLLISNNIPPVSDPSPPTIQILEGQLGSTSEEDKEINEALHAITENRISSPKLVKQSKNFVKILSPTPTKSLIMPQVAQFKQERSTPTKQLSQQQQLLQIASQKQIQIIQKGPEDANHKIKVPTAVQHQIIQSLTPQQLQNMKGVTLLKSSNPTVSSIENSAFTVTVSKSGSGDSLAQPGIQIKTPNNLTPAQQQQLLQTIKQKILPQAMLASQNQHLLLKHKTLLQVQKPGQSNSQSISILGASTKINTENAAAKTPVAATQTPMVAKVLTNASGQVISVENLLGTQKQLAAAGQGTTLRLSGVKSNQPNIIQLAGTSKQNTLAHFVSQNNFVALASQASPAKLLVATPSSTTVTTSTVSANRGINRTVNRAQQQSKITGKVGQQLINAKVVQNIDGQKIVQPKLLVGQQGHIKLGSPTGKNLQKQTLGITNSNTIRMVNAANLNLTHIGGKPVILASKGGTIQNLQGQNVILQAQPTVLQNAVKGIQSSNSTQSGTANLNNLSLVNQQNVVLGQQVKVQQPQVVFKNNALSQGGQSHLVLGGHPVRLQASSTPPQRLVLASQGQGGQILAQQIILPPGFQGAAINIKSLQGVKVIPLAQTAAQGRGVPNRQVFARVVNPTITKSQSSINVGDNTEATSSQDET